MQEKDFNTIWNNQFKDRGFSYKIPDPQLNQYGKITDSKRPFDIVSCCFGRNFYVENKLLKSEYGSFNFNRIEDHQYEHLQNIHVNNNENITIFGIAYYEQRKLFEFIVLDWSLIHYLKHRGKKSILKKEMLKLKDNNYFIKIKSKSFDAQEVLQKRVGINEWKALFEEDE